MLSDLSQGISPSFLIYIKKIYKKRECNVMVPQTTCYYLRLYGCKQEKPPLVTLGSKELQKKGYWVALRIKGKVGEPDQGMTTTKAGLGISRQEQRDSITHRSFCSHALMLLHQDLKIPGERAQLKWLESHTQPLAKAGHISFRIYT